jgi:hypothetical protein
MVVLAGSHSEELAATKARMLDERIQFQRQASRDVHQLEQEAAKVKLRY